MLNSPPSSPSHAHELLTLKQADASYTTIAETPEWKALEEHVAEIDKT